MFDIEKIILESSLYKTIIKRIENNTEDSAMLMHTIFTQLESIENELFLKDFKIHKPIFLDTLREHIMEIVAQEDA